MTNNPFESVSNSEVSERVNAVDVLKDDSTYRTILSLLDLTSLNITDHDLTILSLCDRINGFSSLFPDLQGVAAICVFPRFVPMVRKNISLKSIKIASVGASFPTSQTFTSIKADECRIAVESGADEIDMVLSVGDMISGSHNFVRSEIVAVREAIGEAHLKVILETGVLSEPALIYHASWIAMEAGADFIKTSTGKTPVSATPEAAYVMCCSIRDFFKETGRRVGFKPAGGISSAEESAIYFSVVNEILGEEWLQPALFRIGASRLANSLLSSIKGKDVSYF